MDSEKVQVYKKFYMCSGTSFIVAVGSLFGNIIVPLPIIHHPLILNLTAVEVQSSHFVDILTSALSKPEIWATECLSGRFMADGG